MLELTVLVRANAHVRESCATWLIELITVNWQLPDEVGDRGPLRCAFRGNGYSGNRKPMPKYLPQLLHYMLNGGKN